MEVIAKVEMDRHPITADRNAIVRVAILRDIRSPGGPDVVVAEAEDLEASGSGLIEGWSAQG